MKETMLERVALFEAMRRRFSEKYSSSSISDKESNKVYIYLNAAYALIAAINDTDGEIDDGAVEMLDKLLGDIKATLKIEKN